MGLRYRIPFKDCKNTSYEVRIYRNGYTGEVKELTGAPSCFVVSGTDEDFMYTPIRTSTATISVLDSDLLLDLYSINNQYAPVKFYKNGVLEWTGYIKPEQFTQPYVPTAQNVSVECVSALATLEHLEYKELTPLFGVVSMWVLMKHLIKSANGEYRGVFIPWVYGETSAMSGNVFERITLIENNFIKEEMNLLEVLEAVCKFFNWTIYDIGGFLYFVDADWKGTYRVYDEALENYTETSGSEVLIQDIGYNGSDNNTLDVVPGYNKASVKSLNHVFDDVVKDEEYDILEAYNDDYLVKTYKGSDGPYASRKKFLKPKFWKLRAYYNDGTIIPENVLDAFPNYELNEVFGGILMSEANYKCVGSNNPTPDEGVTDFDYVDSIQVRYSTDGNFNSGVGFVPFLVMKGENAVYADCAISIDASIEVFFDREMAGQGFTKGNGKRLLMIEVSCGSKWYDGTTWVDVYTIFYAEVDDTGKIKSNRTPYTPYKDISGYVIPMDFFIGQPIISIFTPVWLNNDGTGVNTGIKIRNLKFGYAKKEGVVEEGENGDRVYENIVNESYMSEAEEIEFDISSYNKDGASFSKAILNGRWLTNNLYCAVVEEMIRPEELMIRRIVNRYGETKIKLTEAICMTGEISPITRIKERSMAEKTFRMTSGEWDYEQNRLVLQIQEDVQ